MRETTILLLMARINGIDEYTVKSIYAKRFDSFSTADEPSIHRRYTFCNNSMSSTNDARTTNRRAFRIAKVSIWTHTLMYSTLFCGKWPERHTSCPSLVSCSTCWASTPRSASATPFGTRPRSSCTAPHSWTKRRSRENCCERPASNTLHARRVEATRQIAVSLSS